MSSEPISAQAVADSGLVPVEEGEIGGVACLTVDARELHGRLGVGRDFANWIKDRIEEYGFVEAEDYSPNLANRSDGKPGKPRIDYLLTLDMAKELAMVERNEVGRLVRRYFIECERLLSSGEEYRKNQELLSLRRFYYSGAEFRVLVDKQAEAWFVGSDVRRAIGGDQAGALIEGLGGRHSKRVEIPAGGMQRMVKVINESGLRLIFAACLHAGGKNFKKWVNGTLMPSLCRDGGFDLPLPAPTPAGVVQINDEEYSIMANKVRRVVGVLPDSKTARRVVFNTVRVALSLRTINEMPRELLPDALAVIGCIGDAVARARRDALQSGCPDYCQIIGGGNPDAQVLRMEWIRRTGTDVPFRPSWAGIARQLGQSSLPMVAE